MNYPLQALIADGRGAGGQFPADSRYYGSGTLQYTAPDGQSDHLSRAPIRAAARRAQLRHRRAAHRVGRATGST